jgi:hypothetical protein
MLNPLRHVLEPRDLFSAPAIGLQRFGNSAECLQRLSEQIQNVCFFVCGVRAHLQGLAEGLDGVIVAPGRQQAQRDLHVGVPSILWVFAHVLELFARLIEHLGALERTTAFIVVTCGLRFFHASILLFVIRAPEINSGRGGREQEQHPAVDPRWAYKSSSYLLHTRLDWRDASTDWPERYAKKRDRLHF